MMTVQKVSVTATPRGNKIATLSGERAITTGLPTSWLKDFSTGFRLDLLATVRPRYGLNRRKNDKLGYAAHKRKMA